MRISHIGVQPFVLSTIEDRTLILLLPTLGLPQQVALPRPVAVVCRFVRMVPQNQHDVPGVEFLSSPRRRLQYVVAATELLNDVRRHNGYPREIINIVCNRTPVWQNEIVSLVLIRNRAPDVFRISDWGTFLQRSRLTLHSAYLLSPPSGVVRNPTSRAVACTARTSGCSSATNVMTYGASIPDYRSAIDVVIGSFDSVARTSRPALSRPYTTRRGMESAGTDV